MTLQTSDQLGEDREDTVQLSLQSDEPHQLPDCTEAIITEEGPCQFSVQIKGFPMQLLQDVGLLECALMMVEEGLTHHEMRRIINWGKRIVSS